jgi:signal peptidase I
MYGLLLAVIIGGMFLLKSELTVLRVASGSMEPTLPTKSLINVDDEAGYTVGDIITFYADDGDLTTHRLVEVADDGSLITKGDANPTPDVWDKPVFEEDVVGKVVYMTPITTLQFWGTSRGIGILLCFGVIGLMLLWKPDESNETARGA